MDDRPSARDLLRQRNADAAAIDRHLAKEFILVRNARRQRRLPEPRIAFGAEAQAVAVEVIALGDGEAHLDCPVIDRARGKAERLLGVEQIGGAGARSAEEQREEEEECFQALVSAATQSR